MLVANRMAPPRYPARAVAAVIPAPARTAEGSAARRLTLCVTYRPPARFTPRYPGADVADVTSSPVLVQIGPPGSSASHASDPTVLSDVFARIGGATVGKATQTLQINSDNVVGDDLWLWRADHGNSGTVGWTTNTAANGLVVNGAGVTMYGLAVEHYQAVQVQWNGNGGADYFYQSEMPYDPPSQSAWMDGSSDGYPSIAVSDSVTSFQAYGLGVYCYFDVNPGEISANALTSPASSGVQWHDMVTVSLGGTGTIEHIINDTGATVNSGSTVADLTSYS